MHLRFNGGTSVPPDFQDLDPLNREIIQEALNNDGVSKCGVMEWREHCKVKKENVKQ